MPDLKLNTTGDVDVTNGRASLTNDATGETVSQHCTTRIRLFLGEWFLDNTQGVDYFGVVLVKNPDPSAVQSLIRQAIVHTPGVLLIQAYSQQLDKRSRQLFINASIKDDAGNLLPVTGVLG